MTARGNALELGIAHAGAAYRKLRRCAVVKQEIPRMWDGTPRGKAPIDFIGPMGGRTLALEVKETGHGDRFDILDATKLAPAQIKAAHELAACGADVYLVVDFTRHREVYACPWADVAAFLAKPWRASLSLDWCRAYGLLLPESDREDKETRCTFFLDGVKHGDAAVCLARVIAEKSAATERPEREPGPTKAQLELRARFATRPDPKTDPEGYRLYLAHALNDGIDNQIAAAKRTRARGAGVKR